ncbi:hypothetical protein MHBO_002547 [Bonamia ostreae]|uniref:Uncharacterized protein n=1 Tax=Bonamia ostreae TaxID=126728 RepID=A0ABV2AMP0_9EUKA
MLTTISTNGNHDCPMQFTTSNTNSGLHFVIHKSVLPITARVCIDMGDVDDNYSLELRLFYLLENNSRKLILAASAATENNLNLNPAFEFDFPAFMVLKPGKYCWEILQSPLYTIFIGASENRIEAGGIVETPGKKINSPLEIEFSAPSFTFAFEANTMESLYAGFAYFELTELKVCSMINTDLSEYEDFARERNMRDFYRKIQNLRFDLNRFAVSLRQMCMFLVRREFMVIKGFLRKPVETKKIVETPKKSENL